MKKSYFLLAIGVIQSAFSLGMFFESFSSEVDDWGGVSFGTDSSMLYIVWFICAVLFTAYAYFLSKEDKVIETKEETNEDKKEEVK